MTAAPAISREPLTATGAGGNFVVVGTAAEIIDVLRGPRPAPQHDEHCKGYQWFQYLADSEKRMEAVREEARKIIAARRAREDAAEAAEETI